MCASPNLLLNETNHSSMTSICFHERSLQFVWEQPCSTSARRYSSRLFLASMLLEECKPAAMQRPNFCRMHFRRFWRNLFVLYKAVEPPLHSFLIKEKLIQRHSSPCWWKWFYARYKLQIFWTSEVRLSQLWLCWQNMNITFLWWSASMLAVEISRRGKLVMGCLVTF